MKLLLVSHGNLACEMFNVLKMITGSTENVDYMTLPYGADLQEYKNQLINHINNADKILILADLFGGSPFMLASQLFSDPKINEKAALITGMNLPMVLEVASQMNYLEFSEVKQLAENIGKQGIINLENKIS